MQLLQLIRRTTAALLLTILGGAATSAPLAAATTGMSPQETATIPNEVRVVALPGIIDDNLAETLAVFLRSCQTSTVQATALQQACAAALTVPPNNSASALLFFDSYFVAKPLTGSDGSPDVLATSYYEPLLEASSTPWGEFTTPIYAKPDIPRGSVFFTREQIEKGGPEVAPYLKDKVIAYTRRIDAFILSIQGSGRLYMLPDGTLKRVVFSMRNGHSYKSIGRMLADSGKIKKLNLDTIKMYINNHPEEADAIYWYNPAYVFYQLEDVPPGVSGPPGKLNLPLGLSPLRSVAADPALITLGAPIFVTARYDQTRSMARLMIAQDIGNAIIGTRVDIFSGSGPASEQLAKSMFDKSARVWQLVPKYSELTSQPVRYDNQILHQ
jgi:membrane-bound lytic murein transglycosylase A